MNEIDSDTIALPLVGESADERNGTVEVSLLEMQRGREVRAIHCRGDKRLGSYSFRVVDQEWQKCACRSADEPPVEVVQAVEEYGYHVTDVGSRSMEAVDLQYVSRILDVVSDRYTTTSDPLLRGFLSHARDSLAFGMLNLDLRATVVRDHGRDALTDVLTEMWERVSDEYENDHVWLTANEFHDDLARVATDGGYIPPREFDVGNSWTVDEIATSHRFSERHEVESTVSLEKSEVDGNQKLLATIFGENHVDRYTFDVIDSEQQTCVVQGDGPKGRPPIEVIDEVKTAGYEIENISIPQLDDPEWKQLADADHLLGDILQSYEEKATPYEHLDRGQNTIQDAVIVTLNREAMEAKEYLSTLWQAVRMSPLESVDELQSYPLFTALDDFLWDHYADFVATAAKQKVGQIYEERDIF